MPNVPLIAIGLPVFNGAAYLAKALDSLLSQTCTDFEIIVSDNGSADETPEICRRYAARDSRVRYIRHNQNRGAAWNFNFVFGSSKSPFFKWAACDDLYASDFLRRCKESLENDPSAVLAFTKTEWIDEQGRIQIGKKQTVTFSSAVPYERFRQAACNEHACFDVFGLIRSAVLAQTPRLGGFVSSDRVLLAELSLHGRFAEIDDKLFFRRDHSATSTRQHPTVYSRSGWYDIGRAGRMTFPTWRLLREYAAAISRAPLAPVDRALCAVQLLPWLWKKKGKLFSDLRVCVQSIVSGDRSAYSPLGSAPIAVTDLSESLDFSDAEYVADH